MQPELVLALIDAAALGGAALGIAELRRLEPPKASNLAEAFKILEKSISANAPELPVGSTWSEMFERLRGAGVKADWGRMTESLTAYEAYRYGGRPNPVAGAEGIVSLAAKVKRGKVGART